MRGRLLGVASMLVLGLAMTPARALAYWTAPQTLSEPGADAQQLTVAAAGDGTTAVAWSIQQFDDSYRAYVSVRPPESGFGAAQPLGSPGDLDDGQPELAADPRGGILAVWGRATPAGSGLAYARLSADGEFGAPAWLDAGARVNDMQMAVDARGNATVAWRTAYPKSGDPTIMAMTLAPDGTTSPPVAVTSVQPVLNWGLAVAPDGEAAVWWSGMDGASLAFRSTSTGAFGAPEQFSSRYDQRLVLRADGASDFLVAATGYESDPHLPPYLLTAVRPPGGSLSTPRRTDTPRVPTKLVGDPNGAGGVLAFGPYMRTLSADGSVGPEVDEADTNADLLDLAIDAGGRRWALWRGPDADTERLEPQVSTRSPSGAWTPLTTVSGNDENVQAIVSAVGTGGDAIVAWTSEDTAGDYRLEASGTTATAPPPPAAVPLPRQPASLSTSETMQADPARTGRLVGAGLGGPLKPAWTASTGWHGPYAVIDDHRVFSIDHAGTNQLAAIALDAATGRRLWTSAPLDDASVYGLAVADGVVVVTGFGYVEALSASSGATLWSHGFDWQWLPSSPVISGGHVYLDVEGQGGNVYSYRLSDGGQDWMSPLEDAGGPVTLAGDTVFGVGDCGLLYAFAVTDGSERWNHHEGCTGGDGFAAFDGAWLWAFDWSRDGRIYDVATGRLVHRFTGTIPALDTPLAVTASDNDLVALDERSLARRWSFAAGDPLGSDPLIADGTAYVASRAGHVYAVDVATGRLDGQVDAGPLQPNETVGLAGGDGILVVPTAAGLSAFRADRADSTPAAASPAAISGPAPAAPSSPATTASRPSATRTTAAGIATRLRAALQRLEHAHGVRARARMRRTLATLRRAVRQVPAADRPGLRRALALADRALRRYAAHRAVAGRRLARLAQRRLEA